MVLKSDENRTVIPESAQRIPLQASAAVTIAAGGSNMAKIAIPQGERWYIKSWTVTKDADITVTAIEIDNHDTYVVEDLPDTVAKYGAVISADTSVTITAHNAGSSAGTVEIAVTGYILK